ncbi:regulator of chromosome condensation 1/beta-lactamase-inhibitor protein II [Mycena floridula]|nr:regulator of chromosome condensation 1/beta-lactamase-inhibitor protein II [Mycena floridula]
MMAWTLLASGSNAQGQLASGSTDDFHSFHPCIFSPEFSTSDYELLAIVCGANHSLALLKNIGTDTNEIWGCGDGTEGQLGPNDSSATFRPIHVAPHRDYSPKLIGACWQTTYIVFSRTGKTDILVSMGLDDFGDLGIGGVRGAERVHIVKFDHLFKGDFTINSISSGPHHAVLFVDAEGRSLVVGWGTCRHGQLGSQSSAFISLPTIIDAPLAEAAALGSQHTIFLNSSRRIFGCGTNKKGQVQGLDTLENVGSIGCTWNGTYAVVDGMLYAVGSNTKGQLGRLLPSSEPAPVDFPFTSSTHHLLQLACGSEHVLSRFSLNSSNETEVWGWGWNEHGNLGIGSVDDALVPVKIWPTKQSQGTAIGIWAGAGTSWIQIQC